LLAAACGSSGGGGGGSTPSSGSGSSSSSAPAAAFKACLVSDTGTVNDKSFNQSAYEGATQAAAASGGTITAHFGPGMESAATVTAWDPPRSFVAESADLGPDAPPLGCVALFVNMAEPVCEAPPTAARKRRRSDLGGGLRPPPLPPCFRFPHVCPRLLGFRHFATQRGGRFSKHLLQIIGFETATPWPFYTKPLRGSDSRHDPTPKPREDRPDLRRITRGRLGFDRRTQPDDDTSDRRGDALSESRSGATVGD
jgi:hypothetical protein